MRKDYNLENFGYDIGHNGIMEWSQVHVLDRAPSARTKVLNALFLYFFQGDEEKGRYLIKNGIKMREELGVFLYTAAGNCDLGSE